MDTFFNINPESAAFTEYKRQSHNVDDDNTILLIVQWFTGVSHIMGILKIES